MAKRRKNRGGLRKRCSCGERQWDGCPHPWEFRLKIKGQAKRQKVILGVMSKDDAKALADKQRVELRTPASTDPRLTLGDVADRYVKAFADRKHYHLTGLRASEVPAANGTTVKLEAKAIVDITADDIEHAADAWQKKSKDRGRAGLDARRHLLTTARALFNWAIRKKITRVSPFVVEGQSVIAVPTSGSRDRRLETDEEQRLLAAADPFTKDRITAALALGGRGGELLNVTWADVRGDFIYLTTRKTRDHQPKTRRVPIGTELRSVLNRRRKGPNGEDLPDTAHVFGNQVGEPIPRRLAHRWWDATREAAKIPKDDKGRFTLRFHDLRREAGSGMLEAGLDLHEVRDTLGHSNVTMTSSYLSTTLDSLKSAHKKYEAHRRRKALRVVGR